MKPKPNPRDGHAIARDSAIVMLEVPRDRDCSMCSREVSGRQVTVWPDVTAKQIAAGYWIGHWIVCRHCVERMADAAGLL